jgi:hypothetical protein
VHSCRKICTMIRHLLISLIVLAPVVCLADDTATFTRKFSDEAIPFIKQHCLECHGDKEPKADLSLAKDLDAKALMTRRAVWENVLAMVETGQMPPKEQPKPDPVQTDKFITLIKESFDDIDRHAAPDPGRVTVRRLNRVEYNNTIRDLIGVDFDPAEDFPSDDIGHGFDNIGDVLTLSPVLMERYLAAAETIVNRAIVPNPPKPPDRGMGSRYLEPAGQGVPEKKWRGISTRPNTNAIFTGPLHTRYMVPDDGEYNFKLNCYAETTGDAPVQLAILVCGKNVSGGASDDDVAKLSGGAIANLRPFIVLKTIEVTARSADKSQHVNVRIPPTKGFERVAVAIVKPPAPAAAAERPADQPADAINPDQAPGHASRPAGLLAGTVQDRPVARSADPIRQPRISTAGDEGRSRATGRDGDAGSGRRTLVGRRHAAGDDGCAGFAQVSVPTGTRQPRIHRRGRSALSPRRIPARFASVVFPLEHDAGPRAVPTGRAR